MEVQICRVCMGTSPVMINIFEKAPGLEISIEDMIFQYIQCEISEADSYLENICDSCLKDAQSAFEIRQTYEKSHKMFQELIKNKEKSSKHKDRVGGRPHKQICRVCMGTSPVMINIFEKAPGLEISIEDMIFQYIQCEISEEDSYLENICDSCLQDAQSAFEIRQTMEKSYKMILELIKNKEKSSKHKDRVGGRPHKQICRVCLGTSPVMINIFEKAPGLEISTEDMIFQYIQCEISEGDSYLENICDSCLKDAQSAFEIRQTYEKSHKMFQELIKNKEKSSKHKDRVGGRPLKCSHCSKAFSYKSALQTHVLTHTGERPHKCPHCSKSFSIKANLTKHIRTHTGERPYKCSHCSKSFGHSNTLQTHILTHTGERPHKCSDCSKSFLTKSDLQRHFRTHTGERPYKCSQCSKSFVQSKSLKAHILTHTGERPHKCSHCSKSFSTKTNLHHHLRTTTGEKPYKCSQCSKSFPTQWSLKRHCQTHKAAKTLP